MNLPEWTGAAKIFEGMLAGLPPWTQTPPTEIYITGPIALPDADHGFRLGADRCPFGFDTSPTTAMLGLMGFEIHRIRVRVECKILRGKFTPNLVLEAFEQGLLFRLLSRVGPEPYIVQRDFGVPHSQEEELMTRSQWEALASQPRGRGLWWLDVPLVPLFIPGAQRFDFAGDMPGTPGLDHYTLQAKVRLYSREIQSS